ncbi:hypothetical protein [Actinoallomurus vinaceus]|uniref:hypothetical protein n=1 Tax=Actinoallomurus vinaceus TaxID=1080074 RepID=UPI0031E889B6
MGDRVKLTFGVHGVVTAVVRRSKPAFFGYMISIKGGEPQEFPGDCVHEPDRPLLAEWRRWQDSDDLGPYFLAALSAADLAQFRREYAEANPAIARRFPERIPGRGDGVEELHHVTVSVEISRYEAWSSNGAHLRRRHRRFYWLRCSCRQFVAVLDGIREEAWRRELEHYDGHPGGLHGCGRPFAAHDRNVVWTC